MLENVGLRTAAPSDAEEDDDEEDSSSEDDGQLQDSAVSPLQRLRNRPSFQLAKPDPDGTGYVFEDFHPQDFYDMYVCDGRTYHIIPEAVHHYYFVDMCQSCSQHYKKEKGTAKRYCTGSVR